LFDLASSGSEAVLGESGVVLVCPPDFSGHTDEKGLFALFLSLHPYLALDFSIVTTPPPGVFFPFFAPRA